MNKRGLIIDDDNDLSNIIRDMLESYNYEILQARCANDAYNILINNTFDFILLDINLPDQNGFEICKEIRKQTKTPIIFATARISEIDRINGFDIGGDDYILKPYSMKELLSRINALMRRVYGYNTDRIVRFGNIEVNLSSRRVLKDKKEISLSLKEFDLLKYLCEHVNVSITKDELLSEVWGAFSMVDSSTLTVHIRWLREKLEENPADPIYIKTVYKIGYILEVK